MRIWSWILAAGIAVVASVIAYGLQLQPGPIWVSVAIGIAIGLIVPLSIGTGASVWITRDGTLWYGFGRRAQWTAPLAATSGWRPIHAGFLHGLGAEIQQSEVTFLHRKGISFVTMTGWRKKLGVDLVLEHLTADDLRAIRQQLSQNAASPGDRHPHNSDA